MRIGELAKRAGVSVQTLRFYERRRLLRKPRRGANGYRHYTDQDLEIVVTIRKAKRFGFTLREIRRMLALFHVPDEKTGRTPYARGSHACLREVASMAEEKLLEIDRQIASLREARDELAATLRRMTAGTRTG
jgi:DNA-binding transcriptional MerR regulator